MRTDTTDRVETWWADLFGCPKSQLWQGIRVAPHVLLAGYEGTYVAARGDGAHISLPDGFRPTDAESLAAQGIADLLSPDLWRRLESTRTASVIGPSVHHYLDEDPGPGPEVRTLDAFEVAPLATRSTVEEWQESGFDGHTGVSFAVLSPEGTLLAAANLTEFDGVASDVGVLVARDARGRGLGFRVARAATSYAVREHGIARWRARTDNGASLGIATRLGFTPYCTQLAVR